MSHFRNGLDRGKCLRSTRGVAAVEIALLAPILLFFLIAIVDFGLWIREQMLLTSAARAGAQFVLQDPDTNADNTDGVLTSAALAGVASAVQDASGLDAGNITIVPLVFCECANGTAKACTELCGSDQPRKYVAITVTETFTPIFFGSISIPFINVNLGNIVVVGQSTVRLE